MSGSRGFVKGRKTLGAGRGALLDLPVGLVGLVVVGFFGGWGWGGGGFTFEVSVGLVVEVGDGFEEDS